MLSAILGWLSANGTAAVPVARYRGWLLLTVKRDEPGAKRR